MTDELFLKPFRQLLDSVSSPEAVRRIESGAAIGTVWAEIEASGFLDALIACNVGGAGLPFALIGELTAALGGRATVLPIAETIVARALIAQIRTTVPSGPIAIARLVRSQDGWLAQAVPGGRVARHALVQNNTGMLLVELSAGSVSVDGQPRSTVADLRWRHRPVGMPVALPDVDLRAVGATLRAGLIAGAAAQLLDATLRHAAQRVQFGKAIDRQQAVQQQLAQMAEQASLARAAAHIGFVGDLPSCSTTGAVAKCVANDAAATIAAIAHAVHGAIAMSSELDVQLYTRRLAEWRNADGSSPYWADRIGAARLALQASSLDMARSIASHPSASAQPD